MMGMDSPLSRRSLLAGAIGVAAAISPPTSSRAVDPLPNNSPSPNTSGFVKTVLGPLEPSKLGFCQSHEHVCSTSAGFWSAWPEILGGREHFVNTAVEILRKAKDDGLDSFIDLTTMDLGRDIRLMAEVSRKSGVHIVPCTGHWLDPSWSMKQRTMEELTQLFIREIRVGIEGTQIKAGVIKVANDMEGITPFGERLLRAAARASKETSTPISTHTYAPGRIGEKQAEIFEQEHVRPAMVCIGHSDDTTDWGYLSGLAKRGYYIGMDRLRGGSPTAPEAPPPNPPRATLDERLALIKRLVESGYVNRVMLGTDVPILMTLVSAQELASREARNPDGIRFVRRQVIPRLKDLGVSEESLRIMTVENTKRFLVGP
jgi:phosphotriesterase-related protein